MQSWTDLTEEMVWEKKINIKGFTVRNCIQLSSVNTHKNHEKQFMHDNVHENNNHT